MNFFVIPNFIGLTDKNEWEISRKIIQYVSAKKGYELKPS